MLLNANELPLTCYYNAITKLYCNAIAMILTSHCNVIAGLQRPVWECRAELVRKKKSNEVDHPTLESDQNKFDCLWASLPVEVHREVYAAVLEKTDGFIVGLMEEMQRGMLQPEIDSEEEAEDEANGEEV